MNDITRGILNYVLYEFRAGEPIFESYKHFCKGLGDDAMSYKDFDFWWSRFENGKFDLDYDRSNDLPTRGLSDLPNLPLNIIIQKLEWDERSKFRCASKWLQEAVDKCPYTFKTVEFSGPTKNFLVKMKLDNQIVLYREEKRGKLIETPKFGESEVLVEDEFEAWWNALRKLSDRFIANSKLQIETLSFNFLEKFDSYNADVVGEALNLQQLRTGEKLPVKNFKLLFKASDDNDNDISALQELTDTISFLKPGILETIELTLEKTDTQEELYVCFDGLECWEQWKNAKALKTNIVTEIGIEDISHFNQLEIKLTTIEAKDVAYLKDVYQNSPDFEYCFLEVSYDLDESEVVGVLGSEAVLNDDGSYSVGSLRIEIDDDSVCFKKF